MYRPQIILFDGFHLEEKVKICSLESNAHVLITEGVFQRTGGCRKIVPVLRGDDTIKAPTGDIFDKPPGDLS